jgi:hypothetical protein
MTIVPVSGSPLGVGVPVPPLPLPVQDDVLPELPAWERAVVSGLSAAPSAPQPADAVVVGPTDSSPSQERLVRIAAMLRDAELALPVTTRRERDERRERRRRLRAVA